MPINIKMTYLMGLCRCTSAILINQNERLSNDLFSRYSRGHCFLAGTSEDHRTTLYARSSKRKNAHFCSLRLLSGLPATVDVAIRRFNRVLFLFHQEPENCYQSQKHWLLGKGVRARNGKPWARRSPADTEVVRRRKDQNPKAPFLP